MKPGWSEDNPLDNAELVIAAQLMVPLMPMALTPELTQEMADRSLQAARALLVAAGWTVP